MMTRIEMIPVRKLRSEIPKIMIFSEKVGLVPSEWLQCQSEIPENGIDTSDDFQSFLEV